jgi:16S rRNA (cytidine1402-2'-O)-methyltransferase
MRKGVIFLVPVPIGNLRDITLRALDVLASAKLIACEDTRKTAFLLSEHHIPVPKLISFHKFNERSREDQLFTHLESGEDLVIVSDAGSPAISDPALAIIRSAIERNIEIVALPGPTALIPAFSVAGLGEGKFQFLGFLPVKNKEREAIWEQLKSYPYPSIIYESVHHLKATLEALCSALGDRRVSISREISKLYEECIRGSLSEIVADFPITEKGEFVIVLDGAELCEEPFPNPEAEAMLLAFKDVHSKELADMLAARFGITKKEAYSFIIARRRR